MEPERETKKHAKVFIKPCESLHRDQLRTLNVIRGRSKCDSIDAEPKLKEKLEKIGFGEEFLTITDYVANTAPIIIHVSDSILPLILTDGYYKSSFETNT